MTKRAGYCCYMRVRIKTEKLSEFKTLIKELRDQVLAHEPDTLVFEVLQGPTPEELVFFECFTDQAARQRHENQPYHVAMSEAGWACLDGDPIIEFMEPAV